MKIRDGFVTNSSSSSFILVRFNNKTLEDIVMKFIEDINDRDIQGGPSGDSMEFFIEEGYMDVPSSKKEIFESIVKFFGNYCYDEDEYEDVEDINLDKFEEGSIVRELLENKEQILEDMEDITFTNSNMGWQGDDDSRYYENNYSKERLQEYYEQIAEEKGCDVSEVTELDFNEFVAFKMSIEENTYFYRKKDDYEEVTHDFFLE